jgi:hypothetical protein
MIDPVALNKYLHILYIGKLRGGPDNLDKLGGKTIHSVGVVLKFLAKIDAGGTPLDDGVKNPGFRRDQRSHTPLFLSRVGAGYKGLQGILQRGSRHGKTARSLTAENHAVIFYTDKIESPVSVGFLNRRRRGILFDWPGGALRGAGPGRRDRRDYGGLRNRGGDNVPFYRRMRRRLFHGKIPVLCGILFPGGRLGNDSFQKMGLFETLPNVVPVNKEKTGDKD